MSKLADSTAANSTEEARFEAQRLAFAPIAFQATRLLRDELDRINMDFVRHGCRHSRFECRRPS